LIETLSLVITSCDGMSIGDRAQVDADRLLDARDHVDDPGSARPDEAPEPEDDRALVLAKHLEPAQRGHRDDHHTRPTPGIVLPSAAPAARAAPAGEALDARDLDALAASTGPRSPRSSTRRARRTVPAGASRPCAHADLADHALPRRGAGAPLRPHDERPIDEHDAATGPPTPKTMLRGTATPVSASNRKSEPSRTRRPADADDAERRQERLGDEQRDAEQRGARAPSVDRQDVQRRQPEQEADRPADAGNATPGCVNSM
jgi:hypothetical protein